MCSWKMRGARQLRGPLVLCKQQRMPFGGFVLLKALGPRGGQQGGTGEREELFHNVDFKLSPLLGKGLASEPRGNKEAVWAGDS